MYKIHEDFIEWASRYDTGDVTMRSRAMHDEWQKGLRCPVIALNGAEDVDKNYAYLMSLV